jgi:hypothetical protein
MTERKSFSTASMDSDNSDTVEGTVFLTPDTEREYIMDSKNEKKTILMGLTPTKNESYFIEKISFNGDDQRIYKATTQENGDVKVKYYSTIRGDDDELTLIKERKKFKDERLIKKEVLDEYWENHKIMAQKLEAKKNVSDKKEGLNDDDKKNLQDLKKEIDFLEIDLKENPFGKLQSEMTLYVGGKKKQQSRKQKKSLKRKPRKQKKSLKKRR